MKKYNYTELPRIGTFRSLESIQVGDQIILDIAPILDFFQVSPKTYGDISEKDLVNAFLQAAPRQTTTILFKEFTRMMTDRANKLGCELVMDGSKIIEFKEIKLDVLGEIKKLNNKLTEAIADEEYEKCAIYRDQIIELENSLKNKK
jgi:hypothetical protein